MKPLLRHLRGVRCCTILSVSHLLTVELPDEIMSALGVLAGKQCRTPEEQASWLIRQAVIPPRGPGRRSPEPVRRDFGQLFAELAALHLAAGAPTVRELAATISDGADKYQVGHSTVHGLLRGARAPRWPLLEQMVIALHGDVEHFRQLWMTARAGGI